MIQNYFFASTGVQFGNKVKLLTSGQDIFPEILTLIENAQYRIVFQTYYFEADETGQRVAQALITARKRGVDVRIMVDSIGSIFTADQFFQNLRNEGILVHYYHPLRFLKFDSKLFKRNHRKILVVDAQKALIGGFNVANDYWKPLNEGGMFDLGIRMDGPAASEAWELFDRSWQGFNPRKFFTKTEKRKHDRPKMGAQQVTVLGNDHFFDRWKIRRELLFCFSQAKHSIEIMNPYFLPDPGVIAALIEAKKRGVRVRILLPKYTDVVLIDLASKVVQQRLIRHGIEVYKWTGFLHAKMVLVDNLLASIGSFNLDYRSLFHNLEVNVHVFDRGFANEVGELFERELKVSKSIDVQDWKKLSIFSRTLAKVIYRLRAFL